MGIRSLWLLDNLGNPKHSKWRVLFKTYFLSDLRKYNSPMIYNSICCGGDKDYNPVLIILLR